MKCFINGFMHSMDDKDTIYHQLTTEDGKIVALDVMDLRLCDEVIDLQGGHLYPGFVDAHLHIAGYGEFLNTIHLNDIKDQETIIKHLKSHHPSDFIFAVGYLDMGITKHDLDRHFQDISVVLRHNDYHGLTLNSHALRRFEIEDETGILKEEKAVEIMQKIPKPTQKELINHIKRAIHQLYRYGITGGHSDDLYYYLGFEKTTQAFKQALKDHPFRAHLLMHHQVLSDFESSGASWGIVNPYLELGAVKIFYDGTMSSKTALMHAVYKGSDSHGEIVMGQDLFKHALLRARKLGLTVAIHVIGDKGLSDVCQLLSDHPPKAGQKDRMIHATWADIHTVKQMKNLPITLDIQPQFLSSDLPRAYRYFSQKPELIFPWKTYLDNMLILSGSSDAPVETPNPLLGIKDAVYRRSKEDHRVYESDEALSVREAIRLYTTSSHAQSLLQPRGYLKKGYLADFSVFDCDLEKLMERDFERDHVLMTIVDEKVVYQAQ